MSKDEAYYIPMPEEYSRRKLNALYREIPLKDTTSRLYGSISMRQRISTASFL